MSGLIWIQTDTQMVFLKEFFNKVDFEKNQQTTKKHEKFSKRQRVKGGFCAYAKSTKISCADRNILWANLLTYTLLDFGFTLCILMDSSFWFDTINVG